MKIYMIRHGETDWNKKRKLQGQVDIPLNEFGKLLAKETAPALADVPFAVCYTSPLKRAAETARLVLGDREVPIVPDKRIQEMSFGEFEGLCCREDGIFRIRDFATFLMHRKCTSRQKEGNPLKKCVHV